MMFDHLKIAIEAWHVEILEKLPLFPRSAKWRRPSSEVKKVMVI
jgi:hypothetical protein